MNKRLCIKIIYNFSLISGMGHSKPAMVTGGRILVFPGLQTWSRYVLFYILYYNI